MLFVWQIRFLKRQNSHIPEFAHYVLFFIFCNKEKCLTISFSIFASFIFACHLFLMLLVSINYYSKIPNIFINNNKTIIFIYVFFAIRWWEMRAAGARRLEKKARRIHIQDNKKYVSFVLENGSSL